MQLWKENWDQARQNFVNWWEHKGLALHITAPKDSPWEDIPYPPPPASTDIQWFDPVYRAQFSLAQAAHTFFGGVAFPCMDTNCGGPGSLGLFLGCIGKTAPDTVWYEPVIHGNPETYPPLLLDRSNIWWQRHVAVLQEALRLAQERCLVGMPDLIENIDTLAQLRDPQTLLIDLLEHPVWVREKLEEINQAFFKAFDELFEMIRDPWGGNAFGAFSLWGPGKTCKVQCDFSCMISPQMFREFVLPPMVEQCRWLDYSLYHLDGTQALPHLPTLLEMENLDAIEWTPQAGLPGGGSPKWYDIYRRIIRAGKSAQAIGVAAHEVEPLIDAVGSEGLFIWAYAANETEARNLLERLNY